MMTDQTTYTEKDKLIDGIRYLLAVNRIPRDGSHQSYQRGEALLNKRQWDNQNDYWQAKAVLSRWVGAKS